MIKSSDDVRNYWTEKEKKYGEKVILKAVALYDGGHPDYHEPESGLLFLMSGGIYFESFEKQYIFTLKRKKFEKIFIRIELRSISGYSFKANTYPSLKQLSTFFIKPKQSKLEVNFIHNGLNRTAAFRNIIPHDHWEEALKKALTFETGRRGYD